MLFLKLFLSTFSFYAMPSIKKDEKKRLFIARRLFLSFKRPYDISSQVFFKPPPPKKKFKKIIAPHEKKVVSKGF